MTKKIQPVFMVELKGKKEQDYRLGANGTNAFYAVLNSNTLGR